jgi:hypothetical protein
LVRLKAGNSLDITVTVPGAGPGEFIDVFVPAVYLYDPSDHLIAFDEAHDSSDRTVSIHFQVPKNGQGRYTIRVAPSPLVPPPTEGEYALIVSDGEGDGSDAAAAAAMTTSGPSRAEAAGPTEAVGGGDGRGAGRKAGVSSAVKTTAFYGTLDQSDGFLKPPVVWKTSSVGRDIFNTSRFWVRRRAGAATITSLPRAKTLLDAVPELSMSTRTAANPIERGTGAPIR